MVFLRGGGGGRERQISHSSRPASSYRTYRDSDKSLARPTSSSRCILFDGENISFDASLVIYI